MTRDAARSSVFLVAWLALIAWATLGAPTADGLDGERVARWLLLDGDPLPVAMFNLLGVWPLIYAAVLLRDPPQRVPAWPFVLASLGVGAFALLPYLALRRWGAPARPRPGWLRAAVTGRPFAALLAVAATGLVAWGLARGEPAALADLATRSPLTWTMTADLVVLTVTFWAVLADDARRHDGPRWAALIGVIPILGAPVWLLARRAPAGDR
jgi:hypothetical protein